MQDEDATKALRLVEEPPVLLVCLQGLLDHLRPERTSHADIEECPVTDTATDLVVDQLQNLDFDPTCQNTLCETGQTADWIARTHMGCGHDEVRPVGSPCRELITGGVAYGIRMGLTCMCRFCGAAKALTTISDAVTFEPLRSGE